MTGEILLTVLPLTAIAVPFVGAFVVLLASRKAARWVCIAAAGASLLCCLLAAAGFAANGMQPATAPLLKIGSVTIFGIVVDSTSTLLAAAFVGIGLLVTIYSCSYLDARNREHPDKHRRRFYAVFGAFIGAMAGLVFSSTIVGQLFFFEITGACSWSLIGYYGTSTSRAAAMKALIITHLASLGMYCAAATLLLQTGSFELSSIAELPVASKTFVLIAILVAAWGKSAQLPFYLWLPSAMEAPTPVSAYLHGASMVKVGVYIFARALMSAEGVPSEVGWVAIIGAIVTMLFAFLMYLPQDDAKRLLAYSTIAQLSYMFLGFGFGALGSGLAMEGGVAHIFNHAFAKTLFFLVAGALGYTMGTRYLSKVRGLAKKLPLLAAAFVVAALAIGGIPPFGPFFSKFSILAGGFEVATGSVALMAIVLLAILESLLSFAWFLSWMGKVTTGEESEAVAQASPLPAPMAAVFAILIALTLCSGFMAAAWLG